MITHMEKNEGLYKRYWSKGRRKMVFKYTHNLDSFLWEEITRELISNIFVDFAPHHLY